MCNTIKELDKINKSEHDEIRKEISQFRHEIIGRIDGLEGVLVKHAERPPAALSPLLSEIRNDLKDVKEQTMKTNGRVTAIEKWRAYMEGSGATIKGAWGIIGVLVLGAVVALFNMYVQFQGIEYTIAEEVARQISELWKTT